MTSGSSWTEPFSTSTMARRHDVGVLANPDVTISSPIADFASTGIVVGLPTISDLHVTGPSLLTLSQRHCDARTASRAFNGYVEARAVP